jgi:hypothetical protein
MFSLGRRIGPNNLSGVVFKGRITCKLAHQGLDYWPSVIAGVRQHYRGSNRPSFPTGLDPDLSFLEKRTHLPSLPTPKIICEKFELFSQRLN